MPLVEASSSPQLTISGELDIATAGEVRAAGVRVAEGLGDGVRLDVDVSGISFIDSSGLGALVAIRNAAEAAGGSMALLDTPSEMLRLFELAGLSDFFVFLPAAARASDGKP